MTSCSLIALSDYCTDEEIKKATENIKKLGFAEVQKHLSKKKYLNRWAGAPKERLTLFHEACKSKSNAIIACRGGSGVMQFLPEVKFSYLKKNQKSVVGYSDVTPLLNAIYQKTGIVSLHGPTALKELDHKSMSALKKALNKESYGINFTNSQILQKPKEQKIKAVIMGGNLERLRDCVLSPLKINLKNKIIFIEEVDKTEYGIFNILTSLKTSGLFTPKALLIGDLNIKNKKLVGRMLCFLFPKTPIITNLPFGHQLPNITIPIGANCIIDFKENKINFKFPSQKSL